VEKKIINATLYMFLSITEDIQRHVLSFCSIWDLASLLMTNKALSCLHLCNIDVEIEVLGIFVYHFSLWIKKHQVRKINCLKITEYIIINDHCMDNQHLACCTCLEDIQDAFQNVVQDVNVLILSKVTFVGGKEIPIIIPKKIQSLYLDNCYPIYMNWINEIGNLNHLSLCWNEETSWYGWRGDVYLGGKLCNDSLKSFHINYFRFKDDMINFIKTCCEKSNQLTTFSLESLFDDNDDVEIVDSVNVVYPNAVVSYQH
jgi:hypothetical protein